MCILAPKPTTSPKKWSQNHDPLQKPDTKPWICFCAPLVAFEPRNALLAFPWTVCNGLERLWHGFRRVLSSGNPKTSVDLQKADPRGTIPTKNPVQNSGFAVMNFWSRLGRANSSWRFSRLLEMFWSGLGTVFDEFLSLERPQPASKARALNRNSVTRRDLSPGTVVVARSF
jgi:hypothetical protein